MQVTLENKEKQPQPPSFQSLVYSPIPIVTSVVYKNIWDKM